MFKSLLAVAAVSAFSAPVMAGPYVGIDTKSVFTGSDYTSTEFTGKIGYEGSVGTTSYFVEGGPVTLTPDNGEADTELFLATGVGFPITDSIGASAAFKVETNDGADAEYEFTSGLKYSF